MEPDITVLMPCYNAMPYIKDAIDSILKQSYSNFLLYIIYDESNDGTYEFLSTLKDQRINIKRNEYGKGIVNARNYGLDIANTKYVALMDADDIAIMDRLKLERDFLEKHPDVGAVGGITQTISEDGVFLQINGSVGKTASEVKAGLFFGNVCPNGTMMYRNSVVKNENIKYRDDVIEDYLFWCDLSNKAHIVILSNLLLFYRVSDQNRSATVLGGQGSRDRQGHLNMLREYMLTSNDLKLNSYQKEIFFNTVLEGHEKNLTIWETIINSFVYKSLIKQAEENNKEWKDEFIIECKRRKKDELKKLIKRIILR